MSNNPYKGLPGISFWNRGVALSKGSTPKDLYKKKWPILKTDSIATAGSCFAQHIGRYLKQGSFNVMDMEPAPLFLAEDDRSKFGFSIYSARYGNIYTVRQLFQLAQEAFSGVIRPEIVWENVHGLFTDALRPGVEPKGLASPEEVIAHRKHHLHKVRKMLEEMDLMFFTMGLTEAWRHKRSGTVYPTAPGTIAGHYDPEWFEFKNFSFQDVMEDFLRFRQLVHANQKRKCRFILTVSPVPLAATATEKHVMVASVYSKSVLRAVAGALSDHFEDVDYFPSYEIITNPWSNTSFYENNLRSVTSAGVEEVMSVFMREHAGSEDVPHGGASDLLSDRKLMRNFDDDVVCEEAILEFFSGDAK